MFKKYAPHISFLTLLLLVSCATKPQSDVDTPEYHFKAGMRAIDNEDYQQSITSFQRSVDLDSKFALGYGGLGLANAYLKSNKNAKDFASKLQKLQHPCWICLIISTKKKYLSCTGKRF